MTPPATQEFPATLPGQVRLRPGRFVSVGGRACEVLEHLKPHGVAVVVAARHSCMACRGVMKQRPVMVTSAMRGVFRKQGPARAEFFELVKLAERASGEV